MGVSLNGGTPKSSILIGFSIINHPFWGTPIFGNTHVLLKLVHFCNPFLRANPTQDPVDFLADGDGCAIVKT